LRIPITNGVNFGCINTLLRNTSEQYLRTANNRRQQEEAVVAVSAHRGASGASGNNNRSKQSVTISNQLATAHGDGVMSIVYTKAKAVTMVMPDAVATMPNDISLTIG